MVYDSQSLKAKYNGYSNINQKISLECKNGKLTRIKRGLYTDDFMHDLELIANVCYSPSYLSFEYALSQYGMIPEYVSTLTSAVYGKRNNKIYRLHGASFEYQSIPKAVFSKGVIVRRTQQGYCYKIATKEKALCDMLYSTYPVRSIKDLRYLLFEDLRIDEESFLTLNIDLLKEIAPLYHSNTLNVFLNYLKKEHR